MDNNEIKHLINTLVKPGVGNTELESRNHWFTADNYLDGLVSYGCGTTGTKTITPLPSNTIFIYVNFFAYNPGSDYCGLVVSSKSTDTQKLKFYCSTSNGSFSRCADSTWIPTNGNKFYIHQWDRNPTVGQFLILGYKVKAV